MTKLFPIAATLRVLLSDSRAASYARKRCNALSCVGRKRRLAGARIPTLRVGPLLRCSRRYILSIIAWPKPEQETCFAPCIKRAKS